MFRSDRGIHGVGDLREDDVFGENGVVWSWREGNRSLFGDQESVGGDAQRCMMMKATATDVRGQRGQKVCRWLGFVSELFDQAPFLETRVERS